MMRPLRVAGRFLVGMHLDGKRRSDATFLVRGSSGTAHWWGTGRESWWSMLAGWHRAGLRWVTVAVLVGLWHWRHGTEWALALAGGPVVGLLAVRAWRTVSRWTHQRQLVRPMAAALSPFLGVSPIAVESGLVVRRDYEDADAGEHVAALSLPDHWAATPEQKGRVQQVIQARMGVDLKYQWQTNRYPMVLNATRAPVPPAMVLFAEMRAEIDACEPGKVLLGVDAAGKIRYGDLGLEDPHWAINAGSRRGKTTLLLSITSQELHKGAERATLIDPKRVSLEALAGVPGVDLHNDPLNVQDMWDGIAGFRQFMQARIDAYMADRTIEFRRALLVIDEVNMFSAMSDHYWREIKDKSDPAVPPVWHDIAIVAWGGAQFRCNIVVVGQRLDGPTLKGLRDSFGIRLLAGFTPQQYQFLVGLPPVPRSQKPRGRFLLFEGGELSWLQLLKGSETEFRDYAMEGRGLASDLAAMRPGGTGDMPGLFVGLAAAAGHLGMELEAFRKARQRRPVPGELAGPDGRPSWTAEALTAWRDSRPSAGDGLALVSASGDGAA